MISRRIVVEGRVQGVGYRAWVKREAAGRGLTGWVRNRADGSVEAMFTGEADAVRLMIEASRKGPMAAKVRILTEMDATVESLAGFEVRATV